MPGTENSAQAVQGNSEAGGQAPGKMLHRRLHGLKNETVFPSFLFSWEPPHQLSSLAEKRGVAWT